jgi:hypothetical protein
MARPGTGDGLTAPLAEPALLCHIPHMQNSRLSTLDHDLGPEIDMLRNTDRRRDRP